MIQPSMPAFVASVDDDARGKTEGKMRVGRAFLSALVDGDTDEGTEDATRVGCDVYAGVPVAWADDDLHVVEEDVKIGFAVHPFTVGNDEGGKNKTWERARCRCACSYWLPWPKVTQDEKILYVKVG